MFKLFLVTFCLFACHIGMSQEQKPTTPVKEPQIETPIQNPRAAPNQGSLRRNTRQAVKRQQTPQQSLRGVRTEQQAPEQTQPGEPLASEQPEQKKKRFRWLTWKNIGTGIDKTIGVGLGVATLAVIAVPSVVAASNVFD